MPDMKEPAENQFRCDECGGIFDYKWSDEEAKAEAYANGFDPLVCGIVCDACYKSLWPTI